MARTRTRRPTSLRLAPGTLPQAELLKALDTGLFVSNLWYLNYSDRAAGRNDRHGPRYACFWVERGELVAPVDVMRFDDDAFRLFGPGLVALHRRRRGRAEQRHLRRAPARRGHDAGRAGRGLSAWCCDQGALDGHLDRAEPEGEVG